MSENLFNKKELLSIKLASPYVKHDKTAETTLKEAKKFLNGENRSFEDMLQWVNESELILPQEKHLDENGRDYLGMTPEDYLLIDKYIHQTSIVSERKVYGGKLGELKSANKKKQRSFFYFRVGKYEEVEERYKNPAVLKALRYQAKKWLEKEKQRDAVGNYTPYNYTKDDYNAIIEYLTTCLFRVPTHCSLENYQARVLDDLRRVREARSRYSYKYLFSNQKLVSLFVEAHTWKHSVEPPYYRKFMFSSDKEAFDVEHIINNPTLVFSLNKELLSLYFKDASVEEVNQLLELGKSTSWGIPGANERFHPGPMWPILDSPKEKIIVETEENIKKDKHLSSLFANKVISVQPHSPALFSAYTVDIEKLRKNTELEEKLWFGFMASSVGSLMIGAYHLVVTGGMELTIISIGCMFLSLTVGLPLMVSSEKKLKSLTTNKTTTETIESDSNTNHAVTDLKEAYARIASYETDPWKAISYPAFNDVSTPEVSDMFKSLKKAQRLVDNNADNDKLVNAVDDLWVDIKKAEEKAKKMAWSEFSESEQKDFFLAKSLIKQIDDKATTQETRATYYNQLKKVFDRLNEKRDNIPVKIVGEIEAKHSLQIEKLNSTSVEAVVTSYGRGDFFSHGIDVIKYTETD